MRRVNKVKNEMYYLIYNSDNREFLLVRGTSDKNNPICTMIGSSRGSKFNIYDESYEGYTELLPEDEMFKLTNGEVLTHIIAETI